MQIGLDHWFFSGNDNGTRMNLNHWFTSSNKLTVSLWKFYGSIEIVYDGEMVYFPVSIYDDGKEVLRFNFYALNDAISFVEGINKILTKQEVIEYYQKQFAEKEFKLYEKIKNDELFVDNKLVISLWNFFGSIRIVYDGDLISYPVSIIAADREELKFNFYALDDAVSFVEGIEKKFTKEEVIEYYQNEFVQDKFRIYGRSMNKKIR